LLIKSERDETTVIEISEFGFGVKLPMDSGPSKPTVYIKGSMGAFNVILNEFVLQTIYSNLHFLDSIKMDSKITHKIQGEIKKNHFNLIGKTPKQPHNKK
jgi:hypothetical protein